MPGAEATLATGEATIQYPLAFLFLPSVFGILTILPLVFGVVFILRSKGWMRWLGNATPGTNSR